MGMKVEQVLHMVGGAGETSYATNSRVQEKAIFETKTMVEEAVREVYKTVLPENMVVADLGCSSGPNTFHVVSEVPLGVESDTGVPLNEGNIYVSETSPPAVVKSYQEQYRRDFTTFLESRFQELGFGGRMVFTLLGRATERVPSEEPCQLWGLLAEALNAMVLEGIRAVIEPVIARNFGEDMLDDLFSRYAKNVARHLLKEKTKYPLFVIALKAKM
ncbi:putative SAM dependent carboxyl methyltransferase [Cocos nucifera]|uniref:Putative SAM dependent carboxyl methyltransferase n=1 Tax=Cocos nucifera TaxID=13894 RepID=A0A8K0INT3_COCNU|nr:putative SAM dependent carboxyl methyltransferase [Cocos nucifera]